MQPVACRFRHQGAGHRSGDGGAGSGVARFACGCFGERRPAAAGSQGIPPTDAAATLHRIAPALSQLRGAAVAVYAGIDTDADSSGAPAWGAGAGMGMGVTVAQLHLVRNALVRAGVPCVSLLTMR
jgi:hypothetical protein